MSQDRLDRAVEAMRQEAVDEPTLEAVRTRVWNTVSGVTGSGCAEFRPDLAAYVSGALVGSRRVLMEDHLGRCASCRAAMAELRGERQVVAMPRRSSSARWTRWGSLAAAAAVLLAAVYLGRHSIDALFAPSGPRATIVSADGGVYRIAGEPLAAGATLGDREVIRTGAGAHAVLRLADGSTMEVNERTELFASAAWSGLSIHLQRGDVVVQAAKQRRGHLRVMTRDSVASVKGTVFAVSAGLGGSVVSVVEGSVAVNQPGREVLLSPGEQAVSNPSLASSVASAIAWSPDAEQYLELLRSFGKIERQLAEQFPAEQRTSSSLLPYLPAGAFAYGAVPNLHGKIGLAMTLAEQQSSENPALAAWWSSDAGRSVREMVDRLQSVGWLLGNEVVFCAAIAGPDVEIPMVMARVQAGKRAELTNALSGLFAGTPTTTYSVSDDLMVVSNSTASLSWALGNLRQGASSPFARVIGERYQRGTGWLLAIDAPVVVAMAAGDDAPPIELAAMLGVKYLFFEQRAGNGSEENELTLLFEGARTGMAAWLADAGSGGAAEYLPADVPLAGYVSMQQPLQLFQEFSALMGQKDQSFATAIAEVEAKLGAGFIANVSAAMGTEAAFALHGVSVSGPRWSLAALVYNPAVIDSAIQQMVQAVNAELGPDEQDQRVSFTQENAGGRVWNTVAAGSLPFGITWTYDAGHMVAASDRATGERVIATRNAGAPLVWSQTFRGALPASAGLHPSAFIWLNTKGALDAFSTFVSSSPAAAALLAERDPMLVVFDVARDRIHAGSRTRLSGLILDVMALQSVSQAREGVQSPTQTQ